MTKLQEIMNLTMLEADIIQFGKIEDDGDEYYPETTRHDSKRLERFNFYRLREKYYGYEVCLARYSLEDQIREIESFKSYIMENYKED